MSEESAEEESAEKESAEKPGPGADRAMPPPGCEWESGEISPVWRNVDLLQAGAICVHVPAHVCKTSQKETQKYLILSW